MVTVAVLCGALWRPGHFVPVAFVLLALRLPWLVLATTVGWAVVARHRAGRRPSPDDEARLFQHLVAELEGGASPRSALLEVAGTDARIDLTLTARLVQAGMPAPTIADSLAAALPHNGRLASASWALAGESGAPASPVMRALARRAAKRGRLDRDRRALTAQARATAWLIAGLPLLVVGMLAVSGRIDADGAGPIVLVGVGLQGAGLAVVVAMLRRAT